jgi:transcription elongation factor GreA
MPKPLSAQELLRAQGLPADGPVLWGQPARSRKPGIFLVELAGSLAHAPIDIIAVRTWVDRVPGLLLDGERPTPTALADRLGAFWLPAQQVLYVGRTAKTLGPRIAAAYATPLGDRRPHAGGHWLKTLHRVDQLRVWWAETEAPEEYEDALLAAFAETVDPDVRARLHDPSSALPWANLESPTGGRKAHGITGAFLAEEAAPASSMSRPGEETAAGRRSKARSAAGGPGSSRVTRAANAGPTRAAAAASRSAGVGTARRPRSDSGQGKQQEARTHVTADGLAALEAELEELRTVMRPQIVLRVKNARELGDLRENADYEAARNEHSFLEGRIRTIEQMLKTAVVIGMDHTGEVMLGSTVRVEVDGDEMTFRIVGSTEADPAGGWISNVSPVGKALVGHAAGEEVAVTLPGGTTSYRILEVN